MTFASKIVQWQKHHGRHDLPWQNTHDAYKIWLSEIMLQQTQVVTVKTYYDKFLTRFPTVIDLAQASQDDVLALWAGLGYYSRARNLHHCAQTVAGDWGGAFPQLPEQLQTLKGIGASTAAAIAVFAYGYPAPILDGNVKRIMCRYFGVDAPANAVTDKVLWQIAEREIQHLDARNADDLRAYTQGLMDLGASLCSRRQPDCEACPLRTECYAYQHQLTEQLPRAKVPTKVLAMTMDLFIYRYQDQVWLEKRPNAGIWAGLYVFPTEVRLLSESDGETLLATTHRLTHRLLTLNAILWSLSESEARQLEENGQNGVWVSPHNIDSIGMPKPIAAKVRELLNI